MRPEGDRRNANRKAREYDAELDALVAREVEALAAQGTHNAPQMRGSEDYREAAAVATAAPVDSDAKRTTRPAPVARNVIGLHRANGSTRNVPFSPEEEAFIEQAVAFLGDRPAADLVLDEIWSLTLGSRADDSVDLPAAADDAAAEADDLPPAAAPPQPVPTVVKSTVSSLRRAPRRNSHDNQGVSQPPSGDPKDEDPVAP